MRRFITIVAIIGLGLFATFTVQPAFAQTPPATSPAEDLASLIQQLGDPDFHVRDAAEHRIREAGSAAEALLHSATDSSDPEIAMRARRILADMSLGILPNTPPKIVELLTSYRDSDLDHKKEIVEELRKLRPLSGHALARLWLTEKEPNTRDAIFTGHRADETLAWATEMIADGDEGPVPELMRDVAYSDADQLARNAAAYFLLTGTLNAEIAAAEKRLNTDGDKEAGKFLIYAYRANKDLDGAFRMASKYADGHVQADLAQERGDWPAAAAAFAKFHNPWNTSLPYAGRLAIYYRLAGDDAQSKNEVDQMVGDMHDSNDVLKVYFLNDLPVEGMEALLRTASRGARMDQNGSEYIALLCAQLRFREATELAEKRDKRAFNSMLSIAGPLYTFGAVAKATSIYDELQASALADKNADHYTRLAYELHAHGLDDRARQLTDEMFRVVGENAQTLRVLWWMLPQASNEPERWWKLARQLHADEKPELLLSRLDKLFTGKLPPEEAREILERAVSEPADPNSDNDRWLGDIIRFRAQQGLDDANLEKYAAPAMGAQPFQILGDMLAGKGQWDRATAAYGHAWERDRYSRLEHPLSLALRGNAMVKAGHVAEGRAIIERAHRVLMGGDLSRNQFVYGLRNNGMEDDARRQEDLAFRVGPFDDYTALEESEKRADALAKTDPLAAATELERKLLWNTRPGSFFTSPTGYLIVPHQIHGLRATGFERKGDMTAALREWKLCLGYYPYDPDSTAAAVRILEKAGSVEEANDLYTPVRDELQSLCANYPDSSQAHNNLAWLEARCRRDLDPALEQANKATQMEPSSPQYIDTLAEVYLARGEKSKASVYPLPQVRPWEMRSTRSDWPPWVGRNVRALVETAVSQIEPGANRRD